MPSLYHLLDLKIRCHSVHLQALIISSLGFLLEHLCNIDIYNEKTLNIISTNRPQLTQGHLHAPKARKQGIHQEQIFVHAYASTGIAFALQIFF